VLHRYLIIKVIMFQILKFYAAYNDSFCICPIVIWEPIMILETRMKITKVNKFTRY